MAKRDDRRLELAERIAGVVANPEDVPRLVFGSVPVPDNPVTDQVVLRWLEGGLAHISDGILIYVGSGPPRDELGWRAAYGPKSPAPAPPAKDNWQ